MSDDESSTISDFVAFPNNKPTIKAPPETTTVKNKGDAATETSKTAVDVEEVPSSVLVEKPMDTTNKSDTTTTTTTTTTAATPTANKTNKTTTLDKTNKINTTGLPSEADGLNGTVDGEVTVVAVTPSPYKKPARMDFSNEDNVVALFEEVLQVGVFGNKDKVVGNKSTLGAMWQQVAAGLQVRTGRNCSVRACKDNVSKTIMMVESYIKIEKAGGVLPPKHKAFDLAILVKDLMAEQAEQAKAVKAEKAKMAETADSLRKKSATKLIRGKAAFVSLPMKLGPNGPVEDAKVAAAPALHDNRKAARSSSPRFADLFGQLMETRAERVKSTQKDVARDLRHFKKDIETRVSVLEWRMDVMENRYGKRKRPQRSFPMCLFDRTDSSESDE